MDLGAELEKALFTESNLIELCLSGLWLCKNLKVLHCAYTGVWVSLLSVELHPNCENPLWLTTEMQKWTLGVVDYVKADVIP